MKNIRLDLLRLKQANTLKHLRGRHDQRDHAWNRGMGRGGTESSAASSHPKKAKVSEAQHRADIISLQAKVDAGEITYHEMQNKLRDNRGYPPLPPRTRKQLVQDGKGLSRAYADTRQFSPQNISAQAAGSVLQNSNVNMREEALKTINDAIQKIKKYAPMLAASLEEATKQKSRWQALRSGMYVGRMTQEEIDTRSDDAYQKMVEAENAEFDGVDSVEINNTLHSIIGTVITKFIDTTPLPPVENPLGVVKSVSAEIRKLSPRFVELMKELTDTRGMNPDISEKVQEFIELHERINSLTNQVASAIQQYSDEMHTPGAVEKLIPAELQEMFEKAMKEAMSKYDKLAENKDKIRKLEIQRYESMGLTESEYFNDLEDEIEGIPGLGIKPYGDDEYSTQIKKLIKEQEKIRNDYQESALRETAVEQLIDKFLLGMNTAQGLELAIASSIFENLAVDNPVSVIHTTDPNIEQTLLNDKTFTLTQKRKLVETILSLVPQTAFKKEFSAKILDYFYPKEGRASAQAVSNNGYLYMGDTNSVRTWVHETLHLIQTSNDAMQSYMDYWAHNRVTTSGEPLTPLSQLMGGSFKPNELSVKDAVDSPYTLKPYEMRYATGIPSYHEVLTMALDKITTQGFFPIDREHLRVALDALLRFTSTPVGKTTSNNEYQFITPVSAPASARDSSVDVSRQASSSTLGNVNYSSTIYDRRLLSADAADLVDAAPKLKKLIRYLKMIEEDGINSKHTNLTKRFSLLGLDINNDEDIQIFCDLFGIFGKDSAEDTGSLDFWDIPPTLDEQMSIHAAVKLPNGKKIDAWRRMNLATANNGKTYINIYNTSLEQENMIGIGHAMMMRMTAAAQEVKKRTGLPVIVRAEAVSFANDRYGYHVWPKLGYKAELTKDVADMFEQLGFSRAELQDTFTLFDSKKMSTPTQLFPMSMSAIELWPLVIEYFTNDRGDYLEASIIYNPSNPNYKGVQILEEYNQSKRVSRSIKQNRVTNSYDKFLDKIGFAEDFVNDFTALWK